MRTSKDPSEAAGRLVLEVTARLARHRATVPVVERVRAERAFQVSRPGLPPELAGGPLVVLATQRDRLVKIPPGRPARVDSPGPVALFDVLTAPAPVGLAAVGPREVAPVREAIEAFTPPALMMRAHFLTKSIVELAGYLEGRRAAGARVDGILHNGSEEPFLVEFPRGFSGRCVLSSMGPIQVGDVRLADPLLDRLTLISAAGITVVGARVEADLVSVATPASTVTFGRVAEVTGSVVVRRFPRGSSIGGVALGSCRIGGRSGALATHHVVISPQPIAVQYGRDREVWAAW